MGKNDDIRMMMSLEETSWWSLFTLVNLPSFRGSPSSFGLWNFIFRIPPVGSTFGTLFHELSSQLIAKMNIYNNILVRQSLRLSENGLHEQPNLYWWIYEPESGELDELNVYLHPPCHWNGPASRMGILDICGL